MIHLIYFNINVKSNQIILFAHNNLTVNVKGFYAHCTCKNDSKLSSKLLSTLSRTISS